MPCLTRARAFYTVHWLICSTPTDLVCSTSTDWLVLLPSFWSIGPSLQFWWNFCAVSFWSSLSSCVVGVLALWNMLLCSHRGLWLAVAEICWTHTHTHTHTHLQVYRYIYSQALQIRTNDSQGIDVRRAQAMVWTEDTWEQHKHKQFIPAEVLVSSTVQHTLPPGFLLTSHLCYFTS